jgi:RHS repeat-associated protein
MEVTDALGNATTYTYDKSSRMGTVTADGKTTTYAYDENGNRESVKYPGGVSETYAYDKANRLTSLANKKPDGTVISEYAYTYDDAGRQASKTDSYGTTAYTYDEDGRIKKIEAPGKTTVYAYDMSGNRLSLNETYTSDQPSGYTDPNNNTEIQYAVKKSDYLYSKTNELMQLVERMLDASGNEVLEKTTTYLYDVNGNEIRQKVAYVHPHNRSLHQTTGASPYGDDDTGASPDAVIEKVSSTFDGFNRLKQTEHIKDGVRETAEYVYDGDDLRTRKTARSSKDDYAAKVTNYLYDRQNVILETDDAGALSTRYVRGINYIARIDAAAKTSYYLFNGHGDAVQTVSESGDVENQYDYDIFGNPTLTVEVYANAIRYAGEFLDAETGLYYLRARYYNPFIGRFISEDTYEGEVDSPLSLNRYTYVHNEPILFFDPTGHWDDQDKYLTSDAQAAILSLTQQYYDAKTDDERKAAADKAHGIRTGDVNPYEVLGNHLSKDQASNTVLSIISNNDVSEEDKSSIERNSKLNVFVNANLDYHEQEVSTALKIVNTELKSDEKGFWTQDISGNWFDDKKTSERARDAISNQIQTNGPIQLPDVTYSNEMAAIQFFSGSEYTGEWGASTQNTLGVIGIKYQTGTDSTVQELNGSLWNAALSYSKDMVNDDTYKSMIRTQIAKLPYELVYGLLGASAVSGGIKASIAEPETFDTTLPSEPQVKGGPGVNQPVDEFDDSQIYNDAANSRASKVANNAANQGAGDTPLALPSGTGKPGGSLVINYSPNPKLIFSKSEMRAAKYMYEQGNDVVLRHPVGTREEGGTSDLLVNGVKYDVYTPETNSVKQIISRMAQKNSQTSGIVLDLSKTTVTSEDLGNVLARVRGIVSAGEKTPNITDIVIMPK